MSTRINMNGLRDRRSNQEPQFTGTGNNFNNQENVGLKLSMPEEEVPYQPSSSTGISFQSRTATRLFKGKFERGASQEQKFQSTATSCTILSYTEKPTLYEQKNQIVNSPQQQKVYKPEQSNGFKTSINGNFAAKISISQQPSSGLQLYLPDEEDYTQQKEKKLTSLLKLTEPKPIPKKRIMIEKKEEPKIEIEEKAQKEQNIVYKGEQNTKVQSQKVKEVEKQPQQLIEDIPISELKPQNIPSEELIENENELVECPQGCGRKFNKKALESHAKACKLVFMSKRKQFNSQAKRVTSKEQANIVKQVKQKEKRQVTTKLEKTGEAWKTQSQGFRAVIKAIKAEDLPEGEQKEIGAVTCEYCEKKFSQILISKHIPICQVKKQKEKKIKKSSKK